MAIAKEDIKDGYYWVREREFGTQEIVEVDSHIWMTVKFFDAYQSAERLDATMKDFDFIARIEPPEGV